jgi:phosphoglycolate phosphatase
MKDPFRLLVFDWDGTLMDSVARIVDTVHIVTGELGLARLDDDEVKNIIGLGLSQAMDALFPEVDAKVRASVVDRYRFHFVDEQRPPSRLFPQARPTLEALKASGYWLAVATGKSRRGLQRDLSECELDGFFDATRCADEAFSKPHPQMLSQIMDVLGVTVGQTLMIGDTEYDLLMARNAGVSAVGVTYGVHPRDRLLQFSPCKCIDDISELSTWLTP